MADDSGKKITYPAEGLPEEKVIAVDPEESKKRILSGYQYYLVAGIAIIASIFHLYTAAFGLFDAMTQRSWHWMFMGALLFLCYPMSQKRGSKTRIEWLDWILAGALVFGCANILYNYEAIAMREGSAIPSDIYIGCIMVFWSLRARAVLWWPLPIMAIIAILMACSVLICRVFWHTGDSIWMNWLRFFI
ncbi:MAG: hypothetical protein ACLUEQ_05660 [Cloacibacillus evryensis]